MKVIEYTGEVLPDGHLSLPDRIREELSLSPHRSVKITITVETPHVSNEQGGWEVFRLLGRDAVAGKLSNASAEHDKYLYKKQT